MVVGTVSTAISTATVLSGTASGGSDGASPRAHLRSRLLASVGERPGHGYDLRVRLAASETLTMVAVYRALRGLEKDGLVVSQWDEPPSGPARRVYSLA